MEGAVIKIMHQNIGSNKCTEDLQGVCQAVTLASTRTLVPALPPLLSCLYFHLALPASGKLSPSIRCFSVHDKFCLTDTSVRSSYVRCSQPGK